MKNSSEKSLKKLKKVLEQKRKNDQAYILHKKKHMFTKIASNFIREQLWKQSVKSKCENWKTRKVTWKIRNCFESGVKIGISNEKKPNKLAKTFPIIFRTTKHYYNRP